MEGVTIPEFKTPAPVSPTRARERRKKLLLEKLGLKGKNYDLEMLVTLKRKNKNKETDDGWREILINGEYYLIVYNPTHVGIYLDAEEYIKLNGLASSLPTIPETVEEEYDGDGSDLFWNGCDSNCSCSTE